MRPLLILRPEPGATRTAARAAAMGLSPVVAPLFEIRAVAWQPPDPAEFDCVLLTSANAARCGGRGLEALRGLPCYCVGEATAAAARDIRFASVRVGRSDARAAAQRIAADGLGRVLHLCGRDHVAVEHPALRIERRIVYEAVAVERLPDAAAAAIRAGAVVLVHSPRAGALLAALSPARAPASMAAISDAAAEAGGTGWAEVAVAAAPRDEALLEVAAKLCHSAPPGERERA